MIKHLIKFKIDKTDQKKQKMKLTPKVPKNIKKRGKIKSCVMTQNTDKNIMKKNRHLKLIK